MSKPLSVSSLTKQLFSVLLHVLCFWFFVGSGCRPSRRRNAGSFFFLKVVQYFLLRLGRIYTFPLLREIEQFSQGSHICIRTHQGIVQFLNGFIVEIRVFALEFSKIPVAFGL